MLGDAWQRLAAAILAGPTAHIGKVYELTGPRSQDMHALAADYADALGRPITSVDIVPFEAVARPGTAQPPFAWSMSLRAPAQAPWPASTPPIAMIVSRTM